mmetsp:Transcript_4026/g.7193  ORF Transcript_4026/g.7193 Transcript_4026/m.7193 type:complete len:174 (+) Transcript_4026:1512-2033(+)
MSLRRSSFDRTVSQRKNNLWKRYLSCTNLTLPLVKQDRILHYWRLAIMSFTRSTNNDDARRSTATIPAAHVAQFNFNQPGPLGGRPQTASATSTGSFLPPPIQPFVGGVGGQLPVLQNVVHPYPPQPQHPTGGGMQMDIQLQRAMLIDGYPSEEPAKKCCLNQKPCLPAENLD